VHGGVVEPSSVVESGPMPEWSKPLDRALGAGGFAVVWQVAGEGLGAQGGTGKSRPRACADRARGGGARRDRRARGSSPARAGRAAGRARLDRDGAGHRARPRQHPRREPAEDRSRDRARHPDRGVPRAHPRRGLRPPRPQARQHRAPCRRFARHPRSRPRATAPRRSRRSEPRSGRLHRVHGARADPRFLGGARARRHLRARLHPLRAVQWALAVRRRCQRPQSSPPGAAPSAAQRARPHGPTRARTARARLPRQTTGPPATQRARGGSAPARGARRW
jgi:hypothetical protein